MDAHPLPLLPDSTAQHDDTMYNRPHSEDSAVNTLINGAGPAHPPPAHTSLESMHFPAELSRTTLDSHLPPRPRGSVLGEIPTQTFGALNTYAFEQPSSTFGEPAPVPERRVGSLSRRIHGWTWQAFPIGMGTGAVYVTMSGLRDRSTTLRAVETAFYFINMALFLLNISTLTLQAIRK
jgi:hypothetical protein